MSVRGAVRSLGRLLARGLLLAAAGVLRAVDQFPPPRRGSVGGVGSHFVGTAVPSWSERRMFPEGEAGVWAVRLVSLLDPWMSRAEARRLRAVAGRMLRAVEARPDWRALGSALPAAVDALTGGPCDTGHVYTIVPPTPPGRRLGLLVFLHGHGGNLKPGVWAWVEFARRHGFAVVAPSFGYGNWEHPESPKAVKRALDWAASRLPIDPSRAFLAGLSQGGAGVARAAAAFPRDFAGLIFLSGTMEPGVLGGPAFAEGWGGRPVLVIQGGRDHNVTPESVGEGVRLMRRAGADVTEHLDPEADHFLFFARRDEMTALIADWMGRVGPAD